MYNLLRGTVNPQNGRSNINYINYKGSFFFINQILVSIKVAGLFRTRVQVPTKNIRMPKKVYSKTG